MAISKRIRFEIFRRDGFTCRYCGLAGPEGAGLTIDHVIPVTLGGSDDPSNLVAACKDCNAGKSSTSPDGTLVAQVSEDAVRWAAAIKRASEDLLLASKGRGVYRRAFLAQWRTWDDSLAHLDEEWVASLSQWHKAGLPIEILLEDVDIAWSQRKIAAKSSFRYLAGIAWNQLKDMQASARSAVAPVAKSVGPSPSSCTPCWGTVGDSEEDVTCQFGSGGMRESSRDLDWCGGEACLVCHAKYHGYQEGLPEGYEAGRDAEIALNEDSWGKGWDAATELSAGATLVGLMLSAVVDGGLRRLGTPLVLKDPRTEIPLSVASVTQYEDPWAA